MNAAWTVSDKQTGFIHPVILFCVGCQSWTTSTGFRFWFLVRHDDVKPGSLTVMTGDFRKLNIMNKEPKKEEKFITSPHLALVSDCGVSCIEAYGRFLVKHIKTQHLYVIWLLMKKMREHTSERRLTSDLCVATLFVSGFCFGENAPEVSAAQIDSVRSQCYF